MRVVGWVGGVELSSFVWFRVPVVVSDFNVCLGNALLEREGVTVIIPASCSKYGKQASACFSCHYS